MPAQPAATLYYDHSFAGADTAKLLSLIPGIPQSVSKITDVERPLLLIFPSPLHEHNAHMAYLWL